MLKEKNQQHETPKQKQTATEFLSSIPKKMSGGSQLNQSLMITTAQE
jgi:hypothetical protein